MLTFGEKPSTLLQLGSAERFMKESQFLIYGNGQDKPPTGFMFEKQHMKGLYFNQSPNKVTLPKTLILDLVLDNHRPKCGAFFYKVTLVSWVFRI